MLSLRHIAIIMDGNGRWAKSKGLERFLGHRKGTESTISAVEKGVDLNLEHLTLYVFSSENWNRPEREINYLMNLLVEMVDQELPNLMEKDVLLKIIGDLSKVPNKAQKKLANAVEKTKNNSGMQLNLAISYGGRQEIISACQKIAQKAKDGIIEPDRINGEFFAKHLYLGSAPDPDLVIRTGGEHRLSNYLLWQAAYSELYITDTLWPDFRKEDFQEAIDFYHTRQRRFGGVIDE